MKNNRKYFWVGTALLFLIALLIAALCTVFTPNFFRPKTTVETYFKESINGLAVGSPVTYQGVRIGEVQEILLSSAAYPSHHIHLFSKNKSVAVVRMSVYLDKKKVLQQISALNDQGLRVQTQLAGLTGTLFLSLDFLDPKLYPPEVAAFPWKPENPYIPSAISLTNEILDNLTNFFATLKSIQSDLPSSPETTNLNNVRTSLAQLDKVVASVKPEEIKTLLENAEKWIRTSTETMDDVQIQRFNTLLANLTGTARELNKIINSPSSKYLVAQLEQTAGRFNHMVEGNAYDLRSLVISLQSTTQNLAQLTKNWATHLSQRKSSKNPIDPFSIDSEK